MSDVSLVTDEANQVRLPLAGVSYPPAGLMKRYAALLGRESLGSALVKSLELHAHRLAIVGPDTQISYAELDERSDYLACALHESGMRPLDRALFQIANSPELLVCVFGCLKMGIIPVCTLVNHRELEIRTLAEHSGARLWFVQGDDSKYDLRRMALDLRPTLPALAEVVVVGGEPLAGQKSMKSMMLGYERQWARGVSREFTQQLDPFQVAIFQLSGGTTGVSKIIPRFSNDYLYNMRAAFAVSGRGSDDVCFCGGPFLHNAGFVLHWAPSLLAGGTVVVGSDLTEAGIFDLFQTFRPTWAFLPMPLFLRLVAAGKARGLRIDSLKTVVSGAPGFQVREEFGARAINTYGMAEGIVMMPSPDDAIEASDSGVGLPISSMDEIRLVDPDNGCEVVDGQPGELQARGPYTLHGYYRADDRNRASFTADGFLRTGDLMQAQWVGGRKSYVFKSRLKDVIKRAGESISCDELERPLRSYPGVADVAVVGIPDPVYGERACACIVLREGAEKPEVSDLADFFKEQGYAKYKWPEYVHVCDSFPTTSSSKLSKPLLREQAHAALKARLVP